MYRTLVVHACLVAGCGFGGNAIHQGSGPTLKPPTSFTIAGSDPVSATSYSCTSNPYYPGDNNRAQTGSTSGCTYSGTTTVQAVPDREVSYTPAAKRMGLGATLAIGRGTLAYQDKSTATTALRFETT
jgi:hypothetical protein